MEEYIEKLNQLIALKRNKSHKITKKEQMEYISAWSELVAADNGFSERAEQYYYDGFTITGAQPFVKWMLSSGEKIAALNSLFNGLIFGKDNPSTFRVLISTLAQLIKEKNIESELICPLIERIPTFSKNKNNQTIGDGHRAILKYFIGKIGDPSLLPVLSDLDLRPISIDSFIAVFDELIDRLDESSLSKKDAQSLINIKRWLHPDTVNDDRINKTSDNQQGISLPEESNPYDHIAKILNEAITISEKLHKASNDTENKCSYLQREIENLKNQLQTTQRKGSALEEQLADRSNQISELNSTIKHLNETVQEMTSAIEVKDQEIILRTQMMDALSRDRAKQSDEHLHRLASKLKLEYRDFIDAKELPMDRDLGENMREQLKNIFSILINAGIKLD